MPKQKNEETTARKILDSDIYDITEYVDNIKKINIDGVSNPEETLLVGMYGYLGYEISSLLQNAIVTTSEYSNEAIPTRAKFDRNVIVHALYNGVKKVTATPSSMKIFIIIPEKAIVNNMINDKFTIPSSIPINLGGYEFHLDYDINLYRTNLQESSNGSEYGYVYTAHYDMTVPNLISDIENEYLAPIVILKGEDGANYLYIMTNIHQIMYKEIEEKITGTNDIQNKTLTFSFDNQLAYFTVEVNEYDSDKNIQLIPIYDGLYNDNPSITNYCYYQYINSNTIRIKFDPNSYQPRNNADVIIKVYTTNGYSGNIEYNEDVTIYLNSDNYTNLYMIIKQRGDEGAVGGFDKKSIQELKKIIPKEALSRGSITTLTDLKNYFNSINDEKSVVHVFRKEDNIIKRVYYTYCLMKDKYNNVIPTNTIPIYLDSKDQDSIDGTLYIESGTPIYYYKFGDYSQIKELQNKFLGYLKQDAENSATIYKFNDTEVIYGTTVENGFMPCRDRFVMYQTIYFKMYIDSGSIINETTRWYKGVIHGIKIIDLRRMYPKYVDRTGIVHEIGKEVLPLGEVMELDVCLFDEYHEFNPASYTNPIVHIKLYAHNISTVADDYKIDSSSFVMYPNQLHNFLPSGISYFLSQVSFVDAEYMYTTNEESSQGFNKMSLTQGHIIEFCKYNSTNNFKWEVGEIYGIESKVGIINQITVLSYSSQTHSFTYQTFRVPQPTDILQEGDLVIIIPVNDFFYTTPFSIVVNDDEKSDSNRINTSYYLDIINESRYMSFKCINSLSSIQYILTDIHVLRNSYLSQDRYVYTITANIAANIGNISQEMIFRTRLVIVYYKDGYPCAYSFMDYEGNDGSSAIYTTKLFTKPFKTRDSLVDKHTDISKIPETIDSDNRLYIGDKYVYLNSNYTDNDYKIYEPTGNQNYTRKKLSSIYLDQNVTARIYILYKYDDAYDDMGNILESKTFEDGVTREFKYVNKPISSSGKGLLNFVPKTTQFKECPITTGDTSIIEKYTEEFGPNGYSLGSMVLTNVYETIDGINLLYDYSDVMESYVSMLHSTSIDNSISPIITEGVGYIINRVPVVRYFYLYNQDMLNSFIKEVKRKILYVKNAIAPLECTFGLDFKLFNTYGPSNMYYLTDKDGEAEQLIDNVALVLNFRAKFYNENTDKDSIIPLIIDKIKEYIEQLDKLEDIHFPNITTDIESEFSDYLIYFEYTGFNLYDANYQHILTTENMEMLTVVPEFLNVNINDDSSGTPMINIQVVN